MWIWITVGVAAVTIDLLLAKRGLRKINNCESYFK